LKDPKFAKVFALTHHHKEKLIQDTLSFEKHINCFKYCWS